MATSAHFWQIPGFAPFAEGRGRQQTERDAMRRACQESVDVAPDQQSHPATLVVAEDEQIVALDLHYRLERLGYRVVGVTGSGGEAVQIAATHCPDLVLMDIRLQGEMDGIHAAERIRTQLDIPVIFLTAYSDQQTLERAIVAQPYAYLVKPFEERELHTTIEVVLARSRQDRQIKSLNRALEQEIQRREVAEAALHARNEQLEHRNAELDAFAYTVAHDLKGMLTTIAGYAEMLAADIASLPVERAIDAVHRVETAANRMDRVLDELLLLAGVSKQQIAFDLVDMEGVVLNALERLSVEIENAGAILVKPATWPVVVGYGPWIEEAWLNYLSNAIRYGGTPPRLEISAAEQENGMVRFGVQDNGTGLSETEQARLFTPFTQIDRMKQRGTGLGLTIVKRVIERQGGQVGVISERGKGSLFYFTLPRGTV